MKLEVDLICAGVFNKVSAAPGARFGSKDFPFADPR